MITDQSPQHHIWRRPPQQQCITRTSSPPRLVHLCTPAKYISETQRMEKCSHLIVVFIRDRELGGGGQRVKWCKNYKYFGQQLEVTGQVVLCRTWQSRLYFLGSLESFTIFCPSVRLHASDAMHLEILVKITRAVVGFTTGADKSIDRFPPPLQIKAPFSVIDSQCVCFMGLLLQCLRLSNCYGWLWNTAAADSHYLFSHLLQSQFANGCSNLVIYCCQRCAWSKMH